MGKRYYIGYGVVIHDDRGEERSKVGKIYYDEDLRLYYVEHPELAKKYGIIAIPKDRVLRLEIKKGVEVSGVGAEESEKG